MAKDMRISDEAVHDATGRSWSEWQHWLDGQSAEELEHREIVALLKEKAGVKSTWWQQSVATGYEKLTGRRTTGETADAGFQIGVQRTVPLSHERAWRLLTSAEGIGAWLGAGAAVRLKEGAQYQLADGSEGEVRVVHPNKHLRITWQAEGWPRPSTIQARVTPKGDRTVIQFHEEHLPNVEERETRRSHFEAAIDRLLALAEGPGGGA